MPMRHRPAFPWLGGIVVVTSALLLAACSNDGESNFVLATSSTTTTTAAQNSTDDSTVDDNTVDTTATTAVATTQVDVENSTPSDYRTPEQSGHNPDRLGPGVNPWPGTRLHGRHVGGGRGQDRGAT